MAVPSEMRHLSVHRAILRANALICPDDRWFPRAVPVVPRAQAGSGGKTAPRRKGDLVTYEGQPTPHSASSRPTVDAGKLWAGGAATAVVLALIAVVGILIARGVLDIFILAPGEKGTWDAASASTYAICSAIGALAATALMHLLLLTTPQPRMFFGAIMMLLAVVVGVWPFTTGAKLENQVATAALNVVIVLAGWILISGTAHRSSRCPQARRTDHAPRRRLTWRR